MAQPLLSHILLLALALRSGSQNLSVHQLATVVALKGGSVMLNCSYEGRTSKRFASQWDFYRENIYIATWPADKDKQPLNITEEQGPGEEKAFVRHGDRSTHLVITDLQISDAGIYICRIDSILPPPIMSGLGNSTVLRVLAPPTVWLSLSHNDDPILVACTASRFYPVSIQITLSSTCGVPQGLENSTHTMLNRDGTYDTTRRALLTPACYENRTEVICVVKHATGQWSKDLRVLTRDELRLSSGFFLRIGVFTAFVVIVCGIFLGYHVCCENTKVKPPPA